MKKNIRVGILIWCGCFCARLASQAICADSIPLLAIQQTVGSIFGLWGGIFFSLTQFLATDIFTHNVGIWTIGVLGATLCASLVVALNNKATVSWWQPLVAVVVYDIITGLCMGPLLWNQPWLIACVGQIPHTALHLATTAIWWGVFHEKIEQNMHTSVGKTLTNKMRVE